MMTNLCCNRNFSHKKIISIEIVNETFTALNHSKKAYINNAIGLSGLP